MLVRRQRRAQTGGVEPVSLETWVSVVGLLVGIVTIVTVLVRSNARVRIELTAAIVGVRGEVAELRSEVKGDIAGLRTELKGDIARLDGRIDRLGGRIDRVEGRIERVDDRLYALATGLRPLIERVGSGTADVGAARSGDPRPDDEE